MWVLRSKDKVTSGKSSVNLRASITLQISSAASNGRKIDIDIRTYHMVCLPCGRM